MNITIQTQGFDLTPAIRDHVTRQVNFHLANFSAHVISAEVFLRDINGPRGGDDKKVVMVIKPRSRPVVKVERTRADLYVAVTLASRQAKRAVKRSLRKHRHMEKLALRDFQQLPQF